VRRCPRVVVLAAAAALAAAPAVLRAEPEAPAPAPAPARDESPFRLATGFDYRRIHDFGVFAGDIEGSLRTEKGQRARYFNAALLVGDTQYQLSFLQARVGLSVEWVKSRVRFGLGGDTGVISIARATERTPAVALFVGVYGYLSCDLTAETPDRGTPFVLARLSLDDVIGAYPWPMPWGPSLQLGYRF
jgi:hypothetical protein